MNKDLSRRSFLKVGTTAALGLAVAPGIMMGQSKKKKKGAPAPLDRKLKILGVGVGGRGASVLKELETEVFAMWTGNMLPTSSSVILQRRGTTITE